MILGSHGVYAGVLSPRKGCHKLSGTTKVEGLPARLLVSVYNRKTMGWVASALSSPIDGKWAISCIPALGEKGCMVIAQEYSADGTHNAQVFDYVSQYDPTPTTEDAISEGAE